MLLDSTLDVEYEKIRDLSMSTLLPGIAALGVAVGGIAVAVLAIVTVLFDKAYAEVIYEMYPGGWTEAMRPFLIVATAALSASLVAILGIITGQFLGGQWLLLQALIVGLSAGLFAFSLAATIGLVRDLFVHGEARMTLFVGRSPNQQHRDEE